MCRSIYQKLMVIQVHDFIFSFIAIFSVIHNLIINKICRLLLIITNSHLIQDSLEATSYLHVRVDDALQV